MWDLARHSRLFTFYAWNIAHPYMRAKTLAAAAGTPLVAQPVSGFL
jgi:hypothetical protein